MIPLLQRTRRMGTRRLMVGMNKPLKNQASYQGTTTLVGPIENTSGFNPWRASFLSAHKRIQEDMKERTSAAKAGDGSVIYGTAEAVPFQETEFSRRLFSPATFARSRILRSLASPKACLPSPPRYNNQR